jgi:putative transposase
MIPSAAHDLLQTRHSLIAGLMTIRCHAPDDYVEEGSESDEHYWTVCRYVERNPLRANLVRSAAKWRWSSLAERSTTNGGLLAEGPAPLPRRWAAWVERAESPLELMALRRSLVRGAPFGSETWQKQTALRLGLGSSLRPRGRPKKAPAVRK